MPVCAANYLQRNQDVDRNETEERNRQEQKVHSWGLTFDMSGGPPLAGARPLDGGVRRQERLQWHSQILHDASGR